MISFINKYKRWIYLALFICVFVLLFFPILRIFPEQDYLNRKIIFCGSIGIFQSHKNINTLTSQGYIVINGTQYEISSNEINAMRSQIPKLVIGEILIILGTLIAIATIVFINKIKKMPYCIAFILFAIVSPINIPNGSYTYSDYTIFILTSIVCAIDIVRVLYHYRQQIAAKLSVLKPPHKPSKDERIAELEERVRQLEEKEN